MPKLLKCRRCRWVGTRDELEAVRDRTIYGLWNDVCPRCGCRTFIDAEEKQS